MSEDTKQIEFERQNRQRLADEHPTITPREWILIRVALEEKVDFNTDPDLDVEEYYVLIEKLHKIGEGTPK